MTVSAPEIEVQSLGQRAYQLRDRACEFIFTGAIFLSASLLFWVQPMFSKMVLPILGGSSAVWSVAMVVYQGLLLCGYLYAHALNAWVKPRYAAIIHVALTVTAFCTLPIAVVAGFDEPPADNVALWLIALFVASIGLPFFVLAANSPLLQAWFVRSGHPSAHNPYMLYRASNVGSFAVLLAYPVIIEPLMGARAQAQAWSTGFVVLIAAIIACSMFLKRTATTAAPIVAPIPATPTSWRDRMVWMGLAFIPSGLLVAVTAHISTDVAAAPLLWIAPLALYLLTFVFAFADRPIVSEKAWLTAQSVSMPLLVLLFLWSVKAHWTLSLAVHLVGFFIATMVCHTLLYKRRPSATQATGFYVWLSAGGVLGGIFAALIAPTLFTTTLEYPLLLLAAFLVRPDVRKVLRADWIEGALLTAAIATGLVGTYFLLGADLRTGYFATAVMVVCALMLFFIGKPARLAIIAPLMFMLTYLYHPAEGTIYRARSFYGIHKVVDLDNGRFRVLFHGTTVHGGEQLLDDNGAKLEGRPVPLTYYYPGGPYSEAIDAVRARAGGTLGRVALVGLGAGIFTCHRHDGEDWDLYELDPLVIRIAKNEKLFNALAQCAPDAAIIPGDARLMLKKAKPGYNFLALDAFSSDSVPVHLITKEAVGLYKAKMAPHGVIAFNISNRNLELASVVAGAAASNGMVMIVKRDHAELDTEHTMRINAEIALVANSYEDFGKLNGDPSWKRFAPTPGQRIWTDDYSNIVSALIRKLTMPGN